MHAKTSLSLDLDVHMCVIAAGLVPFRISLDESYVVWYFVQKLPTNLFHPLTSKEAFPVAIGRLSEDQGVEGLAASVNIM